MQHSQATPSAILKPEGQCFQIPPFQRNYAWSPTRIQKLIYDVTIASTQDAKHWIGIMLAGDAPEASKCGVKDLGHNCYLILDGQQRMVTLRLLLLAICDEYKRQEGKLPEELDRDAISSIGVHGLDEEDWDHIRSSHVQDHVSHQIDFPDAKLRLCDAYLFIRWVLLNGEDAISEEAPLLPPQSGSEASLIHTWSVDLPNPLNPGELLDIATNVLTKLEISLLLREDRDEAVETIFGVTKWSAD